MTEPDRVEGRARVQLRDHPLVSRHNQLFDVALAAVLAAVFLPSGLTAVRDTQLTGVWSALLPLDLVVLHAALVVRRSRLATSFLVVSAAMFLLVLAPDVLLSDGVRTSGVSPLILPSSVVFFFSLEAVTAYGRLPLPLAGLIVGAAGGALAVVRLWSTPDYYGSAVTGLVPWRLLVGGVVVAGLTAAWALGRYRATRVAWIAALEERARRAEEDRRAAIERARIELEVRTAQAAADERRRIAREMHDVVAHSLAVVVSHAEAGRLVAAQQPEQARSILETIARVGRNALTEMRGLLGLLRDDSGAEHPVAPPLDDRAGPGPASPLEPDLGHGLAPGDGYRGGSGAPLPPQPSLRQLGPLLETVRSAGTAVELSVIGRPQELSPTCDLTAYRVIQEALTNVVKHAGPGARALVRLAWDEELDIMVGDDGCGSSGSTSVMPGRGIPGMRERLEHVGGVLVTAGPRLEVGGFLVNARVPLSHKPAREGAS